MCWWRGGGWVFEVVADEGDGVSGVFFHEPVAGVGDDGFANVDGDVAHDDDLGCADGFRSAYGEDGHGEFRAGEDFVVFCVLGEGFEVLETSVHGSGFGVLGGVELSRGFVGLGGAGAEVVPDAVEVDALAALYEAVFVGTPEGEVPEPVVFDDVVPGRDAGEGRVHDDEAVDLVGVEGGIGVGDHDADVMRDDEGVVEAEGGDDGANVGCLSFFVAAAGGAGGTADAAEVGHDDGVGFDEFGGERSPGVAGFGVAVDEDDCGAGAGGADEDVCACGAMDELLFEGGG